MKRKAILLNHEDPGLMTGKDVNDFSMFLQSNAGGAWYASEIVAYTNISLSDLNKLLDSTKSGKYDYVIMYFSGHGGCKRETFIELNPEEECIQIANLFNLGGRQLSIFDCCRSYPINESHSFAMDSLYKSAADSVQLKAFVRERYDERVMRAMCQPIVLYACSEGECAHDFGRGGIYTQNLLHVCRNFTGSELLVSQAHIEAYDPTVQEAAKHHRNQHPDCFWVKLPARYQLPLALNVSAREGILS